MICILIINLQIETCIFGIFLLNGGVKTMIKLCLVIDDDVMVILS